MEAGGQALLPTRASWAVWSEDLDQGNLEREAEIVPSVALAEMQHSKSTPAPSGPPALTADAWLSGQVEMTGAPSSTHGEGPVNKQMGRSSSTSGRSEFATPIRAKGGPLHATNEDRDRDGSKVCKIHIESLLTPQIFAETMANRVYNTSTATIEEVEPEPEPRVTAAPSIEGAREHTSACVHGPSSTPAH